MRDLPPEQHVAIAQTLTSNSIPALTGLRAVFVFVVVFYHVGIKVPGGLGVTGFFVLSGFLITWLLLREIDASGTISLRDFYRRRALRIFPAYYAFLAVSISADLLLGDERIGPAILPGLFYFTNYYNALNDHPVNSIAHAWSLAVEEQFYLLWPAALLLIARRSRAAVPWVIASLILIVVCWRSYAYLVLDWGSAYAYNAFDCRFDSLAMGCLLAATVQKWGPIVDRTPAFVPLLLLPLIWLADHESVRYTFGFTLASLLLGVMMVQLIALHGHPLWRWLEWRPMRYLGTISYGIYLYHILGIGIGEKLGSPIVGVLASIALAAGSYHLWEVHFLRRKHSQPAASAVASGLQPAPERQTHAS